MKKIRGFLILLIVSMNFAYANGQSSDFDAICQVYTEAYQQESFKKLTASERASYINQKIQETVQPGEALNTLQLIAQVEPSEKYNLLKQAAEMSTGKPWDCPAIQNADLSY